MENNITTKQNTFVSEEEKVIKWEDVQESFKKNFGSEIYNSWLQKIRLYHYRADRIIKKNFNFTI